MAPTASSSRTAKPYDRVGSTVKGKGKATASSNGAPAQLAQTSRKGKKAWRKNIDISNEEEGLEQSRREERITGGRLADKKNDDLFLIDTVGDVEVAKKLRKAPKPLRSLAILNERSAVPSLSSRTTAVPYKKNISSADKARLRRIARKDTDGTSSADIRKAEIVKADAWAAPPPPLQLPGGFGEEAVIKPIVQAPITLQRQRDIYLEHQVGAGRAAEMPEGGVSYNPKAEAHQRLIDLAVEEEKEKLRKEESDAKRSEVLGEAVNARRGAVQGEFASGMQVGPGEPESASDNEDDLEPSTDRTRKTQTKRKTQAQRNKSLRLREAARLSALETTEKKLLKSVASISSVSGSLLKREKALAEAERLRRLAKRERDRLGLEGGEKVGKHCVGKRSVIVQLGEDLAETLRQVRPEGNLFKDRFLALQKKALLEPRVPQLPKRRTRKVKEYEKHAYKRFV